MNTWYWQCIGWKIQCISPHTQPNTLSLFMDALHNEKNHLWHASLHKMLISTDTDYHTYNDQLRLHIQETATMTMYQPCPFVFNINKNFMMQSWQVNSDLVNASVPFLKSNLHFVKWGIRLLRSSVLIVIFILSQKLWAQNLLNTFFQ